MLNEIKTALEKIDERVYYGAAGTLSGEDIWDYIVFSRSTLNVSSNKTGYTDTYSVAIIREEYILDEVVEQVIEAMTSLSGVRLAANDFQYNYTKKPNTNTVIEILVLDFVKPRKK